MTDEATPSPEGVVPEAPGTEVADGQTAAWAGLIPDTFTVRLPGPRRPDRATVRTVLRAAGDLAVLSPRGMTLPLPLVPAVAVLWAAVVGLLLAAVLAYAAGVGGATPLIWLTAHHAPITTDVGGVTLLPLGLLVICVPPLRRAGRFLSAQVDPAGRQVTGVLTAAVIGYAAVGGLVAVLTAAALPSTPVLSAVIWTALAAVVAGGWGVARQRLGRIPVPPIAAALAVAVGIPLAVGALLTAGVLLSGLGDVLAAQSALAQTGQDHLGLTLLQVGYLPNLVVWGAAFAVGTGFTLGAEQRLSPFASGDAVLPDVPALAALPPAAPNATALLPIVVALAGALAAVVFARRVPEPRLRRRISRALILALCTGVIWWVLVALAGGSLGGGRLEYVGPAAGTVLLATVLTAAGTLLWAVLPTLASDARPVAIDLRQRASTAVTAAKEATESRRTADRSG